MRLAGRTGHLSASFSKSVAPKLSLPVVILLNLARQNQSSALPERLILGALSARRVAGAICGAH